MIYRMRVYSNGDIYAFRQTRTAVPYGPRFIGKIENYIHVHEEGVEALMYGSFTIAPRTLFKIAKLNNFLDKLKEMCSTDLNQKQ